MYPFTTDITALIFGTADQTITLFQDFECEVEVEASIEGGEPVAHCTDVFVDGQSLRHGDDLAKRIRLQVMETADEALVAGGSLWDDVSAREGLIYQGLGGNDPDGRWVQS